MNLLLSLRRPLLEGDVKEIVCLRSSMPPSWREVPPEGGGRRVSLLDFLVQKGKLDLTGDVGDATLADLLAESEAFVAALKKQSVQCRMCGECCHRAPVLGLDILAMAGEAITDAAQWAKEHLLLPDPPDLIARQKGIAELMRQSNMTEHDASVLYEYNQSEPISFLQNESDRCVHQRGNLCGVYAQRPFVCRLYLCRFGERLQDLLEIVVTQGTWHAWAVLGVVPMEAIAHNPFAGKQGYDQVKLKEFEFGLEEAMGELFSFF